MKATKLEFRLRVWIITTLYILCFLAPWQYLTTSPHVPRLWSWLALQLFATRLLTSQQAFIVVLIAAIALASTGAFLRLAGTAHLGAETVEAAIPQTHHIVATGPYRFIRNPLYLGSWFTGIAVSLLMPFTGALVFIVAFAVFELRLIGAEEFSLASGDGEAYLAYRSRTGRLLPRMHRSASQAPYVAGNQYPLKIDRTGKARWLPALSAEIFPIGVALSLAILGWTYDAPLLTRAIMVCFGVSLVVKALMPTNRFDAATESRAI